MVGKGRHPILGVWSPDPVLSMVAPVGLAAVAGTALVIDLVSEIRVQGRSLAALAQEGPTASELSPGRRGIAFLPGGGVEEGAALELIGRLGRHWPAVVVRVGPGDHRFATVPVIPLFPGRFSPVRLPTHGVWQPVGAGREPPGPGPVLPRLGGGLVRRILSGQLPARSRWVRAWAPVWEMPWA